MHGLTRIVQRRLGASAANGNVPPLSEPGTSAEYFDTAIGAMMRSVNGGPFIAVGAGTGTIVQVSEFNLAANITTTVLFPVYSTLMTVAMTTTLAASFLNIQQYNTVLFTGGAASNRVCNVRLRLNGALLPVSRANTQNAQTTSQIMSLGMIRRVPVVAGLQTLIVEWTRFGGAVGNSMHCRPLLLPDLSGAYVQLQEHAP